jgi:hypothetical protein
MCFGLRHSLTEYVSYLKNERVHTPCLKNQAGFGHFPICEKRTSSRPDACPNDVEFAIEILTSGDKNHYINTSRNKNRLAVMNLSDFAVDEN